MPDKDQTPKEGPRRRQRAEAEPKPPAPAGAGSGEGAGEQPPPDPAGPEQLRTRLIAQNRIGPDRGRR